MFNDPWTVKNPALDNSSSNNHSASVESSFEDNFQTFNTNTTEATPRPEDTVGLPDSKVYLESLERKLEKLKSGSDVLEQLTARREHCMENLLLGNISLPTDADFGLDHLAGETGRAHQIIRHIAPERAAIHLVELVPIIDYDQLEPTEHLNDDCTRGGGSLVSRRRKSSLEENK